MTKRPRYEVEAIREHKWKKNEVLYNVKWKGYPEEDNTWEPEENLASSVAVNLLSKQGNTDLI